MEYDIVREARNLIGSSYRYGGTDPKGFDCSGLVKYLYSKNDITLQGGSRHIYDQVDRISAKDLKPGDLAFFTLNGKIDHVALISKVTKDQCYIVHSTTSKGVIEQDYLQSPYWTKKFYRYGRVKSAK